MRHHRCVVVLTLIVAASCTVQLPAATPKTDELIARATVYVSEFVARFSGIVAEERFVQEAGPSVTAPKAKGKQLTPDVPRIAVRRELVSDFMLVQIPNDGYWHAFRDVFQVDGSPVRERDERLTDLFLQPVNGAIARAIEIEREGVRYNLGDPVRTLNNPLLALGFLQPRYQSRFRFSLRGVDPEAGPDVWIVEYSERARPTVLRRVPDADLPARGRIWINEHTGTVVRTELLVSEDDVITTSFRFDDVLKLAVPLEMKENYRHKNDYVVGVARYGHFRQFSVHTEERIK